MEPQTGLIIKGCKNCPSTMVAQKETFQRVLLGKKLILNPWLPTTCWQSSAEGGSKQSHSVPAMTPLSHKQLLSCPALQTLLVFNPLTDCTTVEGFQTAGFLKQHFVVVRAQSPTWQCPFCFGFFCSGKPLMLSCPFRAHCLLGWSWLPLGVLLLAKLLINK